MKNKKKIKILKNKKKIRIKLKSYANTLLDKYTKEIVKAVNSTNAIVNGPIPLPTKKKIYTILCSPHVHKKSRDQYELRTHVRLLDVYNASTKTIDVLVGLTFPSGIEIEMKT
ncbi:30S ribosomal protein S10 [Candidatus Shikimatogenerans silvanidophilus]|uniref:30S ribosomal protein S10 n=1 Tax=Candidatus Shikimatogenerans silvanidophilus TaxID=2782547 RepID=UPI001BAA7783|nr:30S ribosomal protein S10 [Candidatus Shikimatogenerans silvanidophilus]